MKKKMKTEKKIEKTHITVSEVGRIAIGRSSSDLPDLVTHATSAENWFVFW